MFRGKNWFNRSLWKPKNVHSLEHLKYLHNVMSKNQNVSESNRSLLVESLRSIAEILIWGDQNDSSVFDFFLEKNMLSFFLKILKQKCGSYVCVQLLQTLNILFENIRNETSLYYLLSNNHVNSIIVHKFDFSDEEVMAYYISFLKTLSLKLNSHTIHFFYNEHTNDFPLYTEAIKFFNHSESMVRIAVRTLTLNVYRVDDKTMLRFIRDKTAAPYFSNLVWFIGNHVIEINSCVEKDIMQLSEQNKLADLVAEHFDHLYYLNDILCLNIEDLNVVLVEKLLNKLIIPLFILSLLPSENVNSNESNNQEFKPRISCALSLFLLSQVFLIVKEKKLVNILAHILLKELCDDISKLVQTSEVNQILSMVSGNNSKDNNNKIEEETNMCVEQPFDNGVLEDSIQEGRNKHSIFNINVTDEEKELILAQELPVEKGSFLEAIFDNLRVQDNDYNVLFALCLLRAIFMNTGINVSLTKSFFSPHVLNQKESYNTVLVDRLVSILTASCHSGCRTRLVTLELAIDLLKTQVIIKGKSILRDEHFAAVIGAKEGSTSLLRSLFQSDDIFLDTFENEYYDLEKKPLNVERLMMDSNLLLQPNSTPMSGVEFSKRFPCGEVERTRRAIRVFLLIRKLVHTLSEEVDNQLPLTNRNACIAVDTSLDLSDCDLITCRVVNKDDTISRRFLTIDSTQLILVDPHTRLLGWGVTKLAGLLQDIEVTSDKNESSCLHVTIRHTNCGPSPYKAKFIFDDHIRSMAAKQKLSKGREKARKKKVSQIAELLEIPVTTQRSLRHVSYNYPSPRSQTSLSDKSGDSSTLSSREESPGRIFNAHKMNLRRTDEVIEMGQLNREEHKSNNQLLTATSSNTCDNIINSSKSSDNNSNGGLKIV